MIQYLTTMQLTPILAMKESIILISLLSVVAVTLVSCASESKTTSTTTRQTTATMEQSPRPMQPIGYRDSNMETGGPGRQ
jgi:TRAP-type uncharacterized transport system fused permease subunit